MAPRDLKDLAGQKIGALAGTTTEQSLRDSLKRADVTAEVVPAKTHSEGIAMLDEGDRRLAAVSRSRRRGKRLATWSWAKR